MKGGAVREVVLGTAAVAIILGAGTAGYVLIEGWSAFDALYMTVLTLSTIGFSEVRPLSGVGRLFTMGLAVVGIGTFATIASRIALILLTSDTLRQRAMQRRIDRLSDHYVIAGYGRLGQRIARDLRAAGREFVVIDRRDDRAVELVEAGHAHVHGDAEEEAVLLAAGIDRAEGLILVLPQDAANVFVALTAREVTDRAGRRLRIVARTNEQTAVNKLTRAGVDKVISPLEIGADRIAQTVLRPNVDRFMEQVLGVDELDLELREVTVEMGSLFDGRSLAQLDFRREFQAVVVGVLRSKTGAWVFNPDAREALGAGDVLIVLASVEQTRRIREQGASASPVR